MIRRLFTIAAVVSLLLCAAVCVLWVRSYRVADLLVRGPRGGEMRAVVSDRGRVYMDTVQGWMFEQPLRWMSVPTGQYDPDGVVVRVFDVSHGAPALGFAVVPLLWAVATVVQRRRRGCCEAGGLCLTCGYDLRATSGRCPECGTAAALVEKPGG